MEADMASHPIRPSSSSSSIADARTPATATTVPREATQPPRVSSSTAQWQTGSGAGAKEAVLQALSPSKAQLNGAAAASPRKAMTPKLRGVLAGLSGASYVPSSQARDSENPEPQRAGSPVSYTHLTLPTICSV
eukprot:3248200-Rhodomonas_salina.1